LMSSTGTQASPSKSCHFRSAEGRKVSLGGVGWTQGTVGGYSGTEHEPGQPVPFQVCKRHDCYKGGSLGGGVPAGKAQGANQSTFGVTTISQTDWDRARECRARTTWAGWGGMCCGNEAGSYLRLIDSCITQLEAQGPSRTCNESEEEEEDGGVVLKCLKSSPAGKRHSTAW